MLGSRGILIVDTYAEMGMYIVESDVGVKDFRYTQEKCGFFFTQGL